MASNSVVAVAAWAWPAAPSLEVCRIAMGLCDYPFALFVTLLAWTVLFFASTDRA
jgi:hypothetical protein